MSWLICLLALETVLEGLLCSLRDGTNLRQRKVLCGLAILILAVTTVLLSVDLWRVWLWSAPFAIYRIINLLRVYTARLTPERLQGMARGAFMWLVSVQVVVSLIAWGAYAFHVERILLDVVTVVQLLGAVILLRSTLHTWRHAGVPSGQKSLTNRELPAISVLIPARNETAALRTCLESLMKSDYPKLEILVLDDCSVTRRTPEIIRSFAQHGVRFIQGTPPDEARWLPKNYAYEQLAEVASGDLLLFCGVDALFNPDAIRKLVTILERRNKNMLSVMPLRYRTGREYTSLYQAMRYYWELCLPRRVFKRPPVLSTCWLVRREAYVKMGGFASVGRSMSPEALFARQAVTTDSYSFIRGDDTLGVYSNKPAVEQFGTSVRVRYPQLHRRVELVALVTLAEIAFLLGPIIGLALAGKLSHSLEYVMVWGVALAFVLVTYGFAAVGTRLANPLHGWLLMPAAVVLDIIVVHISLIRYEFGEVEWKGRNVCLSVMQLTPPNN